jgi:hypothetical protein
VADNIETTSDRGLELLEEDLCSLMTVDFSVLGVGFGRISRGVF